MVAEMDERKLLGGKYLAAGAAKGKLVDGLTQLHGYVSQLEQDVDSSSLDTVAAALARKYILDHQEAEVRVLAACCLADIFHIYAPNAPYTDAQLGGIFRLFVAELSDGLRDPAAPLFDLRFYLLDLVGVVSEANSMLWPQCLDILATCVEELESVPESLLDILFEPLTECPTPYLLSGEIDIAKSPAFHLVCGLVKRKVDHLRAPVSALVKAHLTGRVPGESTVLSRHLPMLVWELCRTDNTLLMPVMGDLVAAAEGDGSDAAEEDRLELVNTLASVFGSGGQAGKRAAATLYLASFTTFLQRFEDGSAAVRSLMIRFAKEFMANHPELVSGTNIVACLEGRIMDAEDQVRLNAVRTVADYVCCTTTHHVDLGPLLRQLCTRLRDKKPDVRKAAFLGAGRIYRHLLKVWGLEWTPRQRTRAGWIPSAVLRCYFHPQTDMRYFVDHVLDDLILPATYSPEERTDVLFRNVLPGLDTNGLKALHLMLRDKVMFRKHMATYFSQRSKKNHNTQKEVALLAKRLGADLKDSYATHLGKMILLGGSAKRQQDKSSVICAHLQALARTDASYEDMRKAKVGLRKLAHMPRQQKDYSLCLLYLQQKLSFRSVAPEVLSAVLGQLVGDDGLGEEEEASTFEFLGRFAAYAPHLLAPHYSSLLGLVGSRPVETLRILSCTQPGGAPPKKLHSTLTSLIEEGSARETKFAIRTYCTALPKRAEGILSASLTDCVEDLEVLFAAARRGGRRNLRRTWNQVTRQLVTCTEVLAQYPQLAKGISEELVHDVAQGLVGRTYEDFCLTGEDEDEDMGVEDGLSAAARVQMHGGKFLYQFARAVVEKKAAKDSTDAAIAAVGYLVEAAQGRVEAGGEVDSYHVRRKAARQAVKVFGWQAADAAMDEGRLRQLAHVGLDETSIDGEPTLGASFARLVFEKLIAMAIPLRHLAILVLALYNQSAQSEVKSFLATVIGKQREFLKRAPTNDAAKLCQTMPEYSLPYAVHLVAHSNSFAEDDDGTKRHTTHVLEVYLNDLLTGDGNFPFVLQMLELLKTTEDATVEAGATNDNMYTVCDIALSLVHARSNKKHWSGKRAAGPLEIRLPTRLFRTNNDGETVLENAQRKYLPANFHLPDHSKRARILDLDPDATDTDGAVSAPATPAKRAHTPGKRTNTPGKGSNTPSKRSNTPGKRTSTPGKRTPAKGSPSTSSAKRSRGKRVTPAKGGKVLDASNPLAQLKRRNLNEELNPSPAKKRRIAKDSKQSAGTGQGKENETHTATSRPPPYPT